MNNDRIAAIRERCEKAIEGPWIAAEMTSHKSRKHGSRFYKVVTKADTSDQICYYVQTAKTADFIAHAIDDMPFLLNELDRLNAELASYKRTGLKPGDYSEMFVQLLKYKDAEKQSGNTANIIEQLSIEVDTLRAALASSQRREQAAVKFIEWFNYAFCYCMPVEYQVRYKEWCGPQEGGE